MLFRNLYKVSALFLLMGALHAFAQTNTVPELASSAGVPLPVSAIGSAEPGQTLAYRIGVDDILTVNVWHEPDISRSVPVRPDGKISLPLVGELQASGKTIMELQDEIRISLGQFLKDPEVVVILSEMRSKRVNVIGQVARPGTYPLSQSMGVLDALAVAGGLKEFAKKNKIYVLRIAPNGQRARIAYNYNNVLKGKRNIQDLTLLPRDTVVVP